VAVIFSKNGVLKLRDNISNVSKVTVKYVIVFLSQPAVTESEGGICNVMCEEELDVR
jgi:hypothetical protein